MYTVKEMQLGLRDEFLYLLCENCHSIQISEIPVDQSKYYPQKDYYSLSSSALNNKIYSFLLGIISKKSFYRKGLVFRILDRYGLCDYSLLSIGKLDPPLHWRILDVGSGAGQLLYMLKKMGYTDLVGIDPFVSETNYPVEIKKISIDGLKEDEKFDLIMFHHSFEHIADPINTLIKAKINLRDGGTILLRTPLVAYAFEKYHENWFQLDAPRHLHLQSLEGIKIMLDKAGLYLREWYCDSRDEQFYVSENYQNNISMKESKKTPLSSLMTVLFSSKRNKYRQEAKKINKEMKGDTITYYVSK